MDGSANKIKIIVICGPTATGKTELAFRLCQVFDGELVGADSMQVYKGLTVGTAAPLPTDFPDIPRHLISCLPAESTFSVADYLCEAKKIIAQIANRRKIPVVCGGTGLYIDSLVNGLTFTEKKIDETIIKKLEQAWETVGPEGMHMRLSGVDAVCAERLHPNDKKRILRALAENEADGTTLAQRNAASRRKESPFDALVLGLCYDDRQEQYHRIEARVDGMMEGGLLEEAQRVYVEKERYRTAAQAIGYKEFFPFFEGESDLEECISRLKQATRRYAKRQLTWFWHHSLQRWIFVDKTEPLEQARRAAAEFLQF